MAITSSRRVTRIADDTRTVRHDNLAAEEPLEIRVGGRPLAVTMRTPGHDFELTAGFLLAEGIVGGADDIGAMRYCVGEEVQQYNVVDVAGPAPVEATRAAQRGFERTGGLHAAGLFDAGGGMVCVREDVGRHNAFDKVIGWAALDRRLPLTGHVILASGRASFELVQKATMAGIPLLAAVSAPSSLDVDLAEEAGMTLIGFLRGETMNVYSGAWRVT